MKFKTLLALIGATPLLLTGCANTTVQSKTVSVTKIEKNITKNQTTLADLRAMLGTPLVIGKTNDDHKKITGFLLRTETHFAKNFAKHMLTFGIASSNDAYVVKNAVFKFDDNDRVIDYRFNGYSYINRHRMTPWNEAQRELTEEELRSDISYTEDEAYDKYLETVAKEKGVAVSDLDKKEKGKEFPFCNFYCQGVNGTLKAFGPFTVIDSNPASEPQDGSKSDLVE